MNTDNTNLNGARSLFERLRDQAEAEVPQWAPWEVRELHTSQVALSGPNGEDFDIFATEGGHWRAWSYGIEFDGGRDRDKVLAWFADKMESLVEQEIGPTAGMAAMARAIRELLAEKS